MFDILLFLLYILGKEEIWMAKYSAEELSSRVNELDLDDDVKISLMEDITDSMDDSGYKELEQELANKNEELANKDIEYNNLLTKYKERFFSSDENKEEKELKEKENEEKIIDIKELF
jgi:hypothetical protein